MNKGQENNQQIPQEHLPKIEQVIDRYTREVGELKHNIMVMEIQVENLVKALQAKDAELVELQEQLKPPAE